MTSVNEKAYAKINISLDVTGKRPDGYHDMLMVMQTITLCDDITVVLTPGEASRAECNLRFVPCDERNLAVRAANAFFAHCGVENMGAHIKMQKRIPVGAGMAGGSSDAAAVLRALNVLCKTGLSCAQLEMIAAEIGSDVAFCVSGGTQLASGRGEILSVLPPMPDCEVVVCKPDFSCQRQSCSGGLTLSSCVATRIRRGSSSFSVRAICRRSRGECTTCLRMYPTGDITRSPG